MTVIETAIKDIILADSTLRGLVGSAVRPLYGSQIDARPFVTYKIAGEENTLTASGPSQYTKANVELGIYADTAAAVTQIGANLKRVFAGTRVSTNTVLIGCSFLDDETDIEEAIQPGKPTPVFVRAQTYRMVYRVLS